MPKFMCCICCQALPGRKYDEEKPILGPCCFDISCKSIPSGTTTCCQSLGCVDFGLGKLQWMFQLGSYDLRPIMNHDEAGTIKVLHDIPKGAWQEGCTAMGCLCCCGCPRLDCSQLCYGKYINIERKRQQAEYTWVEESRMEFSRPWVSVLPPKNCLQCAGQALCMGYCCSDLGIIDSISTVYYDDEMFDVVKDSAGKFARFTRWWFGAYGEPIAFKRRMCPQLLPCIPAAVCGRTVLQVDVPVGTAKDYVKKITEARDAARQRAGLGANSPKQSEKASLVMQR